MAKFARVTLPDDVADEQEEYLFHCPGCDYGHWVRVKGPHPCWQWNGDLDRPTVAQSLLVNGLQSRPHERCHSYIADGRIQFLDDSTHALKGQTVEIPEWEP